MVSAIKSFKSRYNFISSTSVVINQRNSNRDNFGNNLRQSSFLDRIGSVLTANIVTAENSTAVGERTNKISSIVPVCIQQYSKQLLEGICKYCNGFKIALFNMKRANSLLASTSLTDEEIQYVINKLPWKYTRGDIENAEWINDASTKMWPTIKKKMNNFVQPMLSERTNKQQADNYNKHTIKQNSSFLWNTIYWWQSSIKGYLFSSNKDEASINGKRRLPARSLRQLKPCVYQKIVRKNNLKLVTSATESCKLQKTKRSHATTTRRSNKKSKFYKKNRNSLANRTNIRLPLNFKLYKFELGQFTPKITGVRFVDCDKSSGYLKQDNSLIFDCELEYKSDHSMTIEVGGPFEFLLKKLQLLQRIRITVNQRLLMNDCQQLLLSEHIQAAPIVPIQANLIAENKRLFKFRRHTSQTGTNAMMITDPLLERTDENGNTGCRKYNCPEKFQLNYLRVALLETPQLDWRIKGSFSLLNNLYAKYIVKRLFERIIRLLMPYDMRIGNKLLLSTWW